MSNVPNNTGRMRFGTPEDAIEYHSSMALETADNDDARYHIRQLRQYLEGMEALR